MPPHGFDNLGVVDRTTDIRDISLGAITAPVYTFPSVFTNEKAWGSSVEYQGKRPACGSHSGTKLEGLRRAARFSPRYTWANIKSFDGYSVHDGTDMRSIFKSLTKTGCLDFPLMGNDVSLEDEAYAHPVITPAMNQNAGLHKAPGYGFGNDISFSGLKQYIYEHGAIIITIDVGSEFWTATNGQTSWLEADILPLRPPKLVTSGHYIVAHSYDEDRIYFINSWSDQWGRKGHGYFGRNYMANVRDAGALISLLFTKDLSFGMTDLEVEILQQVLNKDVRTRIASSGAGSPGQETTYFGQLTKNAVIKFQNLYAITPSAGYVGPLTRAVMSALV